MTERIAIPTRDGQALFGFGRAQVMVVAEVEDGQVVRREERPSPDPEHVSPRHHHLMLDLVQDCGVVIASHMGAAMATSLRHAGKQVLLAPGPSAEVCLAAYTAAQRGGKSLLPFPSEWPQGKAAAPALLPIEGLRAGPGGPRPA